MRIASDSTSTSPPSSSADESQLASGESWTTDAADDLYGVSAWGGGYFAISDNGNLVIKPAGNDGPTIDIKEIVDSLREQSYTTPLVLRFADVLAARLGELHAAFQTAISENEYQGDYFAVYPIKVNQQRRVVEEVFSHGREFGFGLEVGSKPELLAVLAMTNEEPSRPIICNGFKDSQYLEAVILGMKLGRNIIPVVENFDELQMILSHAEKHGVRPRIGVRVKLASQGAGRWRSSAGVRSKFGLFVSEVLRLVEELRSRDMLDCLELVHCHVGSQVNDIRTIKDAINELAHVYVGLKQLGAGLKFLDIGGGLGVDYNGQQTNSDSSMNYSMTEYASDVVYRIASVCNRASIEHPTIISESGRAMVAFSSMLVFDVLGSTSVNEKVNRLQEYPQDPTTCPQPIQDLYQALTNLDEETFMESYHDAVQARDQMFHLFNSGYVTLKERGVGERLFWTLCTRVRELAHQLDAMPDELEDLDFMLSEIYFCNFSLFQSLPDSWAIGQLFPVMPIHRLNEKPDAEAVLVDITCDSDGRIDEFITSNEIQRTLPVHSLKDQEGYCLGVFLVGAYQETLGDLHNLFGDTHCVHIRLDENRKWTIDDVVQGDRICDVLGYVQFDCQELENMFANDCDLAAADGRMTPQEAAECRAFFEKNLQSSTYLATL